MRDSLAVEREQLLRMIGELERFCSSLQDVKAGVSDAWMVELKRLRMQVEESSSPTKLKVAWEAGEIILRAAAAELIRLMFETLSCVSTAIYLRSCTYAPRRVHQIPTRSRWPYAA